MKKVLAILIGIFVIGCGGSDRPAKPDNLIPKEKMSDIVYDVFILNAAKGINKRVLEQNGVFPQAYVYEKYKIDSLQFATSNDYYSYDTETYEEIMEKVKQKIELEKTKNDAIILKEEKKQDSIQKSKKELKSLDSVIVVEPELQDKSFILKFWLRYYD